MRCKWQRGSPSRDEHHKSDSQHDANKPREVMPIVLKQNEKENGTAHDVIDREIPEIRPAERAGHNSDDDYKGVQDEAQELPGLDGLLRAGVDLRPGVHDGGHGDDKEDIDIVGMQVAENRRVAGEFVNGFVRDIRVVADKTRTVREPVVQRFAVARGQPRLDEAVDDIMHISAECGGDSGQRGREPAFKRLVRTVTRKLPDQGKRKDKGHGGNEAAHQIVALTCRRTAEAHEDAGDILAAVVVIDRLTAEPGILKRHIAASRKGGQKAVVHKLFRAHGLRLKADDIDGNSEQRKEEEFFDCAQNQRVFVCSREQIGSFHPEPDEEPGAIA